MLHHAGRSYKCGAPSIEEMQRIQAQDMARKRPFQDAGYHYAISCEGTIFEARDIRYIGEHVEKGNAGKIGPIYPERVKVTNMNTVSSHSPIRSGGSKI